MNLLRSLIVDDEPLARGLLRSMLDAHPDVEVVGEAGSGRQAVEAVRGEQPDLLFLDVQMPGLDGFEVLQALASDRLPEVVFVTAYDQYALRAFEVHALDYLLKPFDEERLARALDRARAHLRAPDREQDRQRILDLLDELRGVRRYRERLVIKVGERAFLQPVADIDWIEADGKYVKVHVGPKHHVIRDTMTQLAEVLNPEQFLRISRSAIVNLDRILGYEEEELVSIDFTGNPHSSIVDAPTTNVIGGLVKVMAWYDNEWGYSCRCVDLARYMGERL